MCCKLLAIEEIDKRELVWCDHCTPGVGCGIYETRPKSCRDFECQWLKSQRLPIPMVPALRPDRSHVVIGATTDAKGVVFYVDPARPDAHHNPLLKAIARNALRGGLKVFRLCGQRRTQVFGVDL